VSDATPEIRSACPPPPALVGALLVGLIGSLGALVSAGVILGMGTHPGWLFLTPLIPLGLAALAVMLAHVEAGLCLIAFAICPLGVVQREIVGVTVGLPEVLILLVFAKEAFFFLLRRERFPAAFPWPCILAYAAVALLGMHTGWKHGHNPIAILQDCRQFTEFIMVYILVIHRVRSRRLMRRILLCYVLGGTILAAHGILERFTNIGVPLNQVLSDAVYHGGTRSGSFYGATPLGGLLVLTVCSIIALVLSTRSFVARIWLAAAGVVCVAAIVFTNTRASWVALLFALVFVFLSIRRSVLLVSGVIIASMLFSMTLGPLVAVRMKKIEFTKGERSLLERVDYYTVAWYIFRDYPLRGLGWGAQYTRASILQNKRYIPRRPYREIERNLSNEESTVHSAYLQLLTKLGLVGLAGFLVIIIHWLVQVMRERRMSTRKELDHNLFIATAGGVLGYLLHSSLENFFQWPVMAQSFWLFLGLTTLMAHRLLTQQGQLEVDAPQPPATVPAET